MKCDHCGHENPSGKVFCERCGHRIAARIRNGDDRGNDTRSLIAKIDALERDLAARQTEIENLERQVNRLSKEREALIANPPEMKATLAKLDEKEMQLETTLAELEKLRKQLLGLPKTAPPPPPAGAGAETLVFIRSHPIRRAEFDVALPSDRKSLDLSTTGFHIRANIERTAKGFDLVVHDGATINVQAPGKRWQRYSGGARLSADPGTVFFDTKGVMNARLEWTS